ncbi:MAG TPA: ferritin-like domain-containing protein [Burkholderiales bacterium]|nr:ferritin-like domain-containing protein [Burkholderiales bacterium]
MSTPLADTYALFIETKNFHCHVSGPASVDYHLLFEEQAAQILAIPDLIAERVRMIGGAQSAPSWPSAPCVKPRLLLWKTPG